MLPAKTDLCHNELAIIQRCLAVKINVCHTDTTSSSKDGVLDLDHANDVKSSGASREVNVDLAV